MSPLPRSATPTFLLDWEKFGRAWEEQLTENRKRNFTWNQITKKDKAELARELFSMSKQHCGFCDEFPAGSGFQKTIEHFKPKKKFPLEAYHWENLYPCCNVCQSKIEQYSEHLLRPDAPDFSFERYFILDFATFRIEPRPDASPDDQYRARITRDIYKFNLPDRCFSRKLTYSDFRLKLENGCHIDDMPFRFLQAYI